MNGGNVLKNAYKFGDTLRIKAGPFLAELLTHGDRVCDHVKAGGTFEPDTLKQWAAMCLAAQSEIVVDAGAYTGLFSIIAAKAGANPICFEPMPTNVERIHLNAQLNHVSFDVRPFALSDKQESTSFRFNPKVKGLTSGGSLMESDKRTSNFSVQCLPLDDCELPTCAAIKIDVEGGEAKVLRGARETVRRCKPTIIAEVLNARAEAAMSDVMRELDYQRIDVLDVRNWLLAPL